MSFISNRSQVAQSQHYCIQPFKSFCSSSRHKSFVRSGYSFSVPKRQLAQNCKNVNNKKNKNSQRDHKVMFLSLYYVTTSSVLYTHLSLLKRLN
ncbi:hypothetical protein Hanom_Chr04g00336081 [Helianthus anomalus]